MSNLIIPKDYKAALDLKQTELAIKQIKDFFLRSFSTELRLRRVTAPLFVLRGLGLNDDLNGIERPVSFPIKDMNESMAEVVHSLAKWKRLALKRYRFTVGNGLYTDMNAIRRDEELDNIHSIYVDQWDWEKVITDQNRNLDYLKLIVRAIVNAICSTNDRLHVRYPQLRTNLSREVSFITTQELEDMYPDKSGKERETLYTKEHGAVCLMQIGGKLRSGKPHDGRSPDYDDWNLNCDILLYYPVLDIALEISSMGIRVDEDSLADQLEKSGCNDRRELPFHKAILENRLPYTIGGGIGQSRLCMYFLGKLHIGEVHVSVWPAEQEAALNEQGCYLL